MRERFLFWGKNMSNKGIPLNGEVIKLGRKLEADPTNPALLAQVNAMGVGGLVVRRHLGEARAEKLGLGTHPDFPNKIISTAALRGSSVIVEQSKSQELPPLSTSEQARLLMRNTGRAQPIVDRKQELVVVTYGKPISPTHALKEWSRQKQAPVESRLSLLQRTPSLVTARVSTMNHGSEFGLGSNGYGSVNTEAIALFSRLATPPKNKDVIYDGSGVYGQRDEEFSVGWLDAEGYSVPFLRVHGSHGVLAEANITVIDPRKNLNLTGVGRAYKLESSSVLAIDRQLLSVMDETMNMFPGDEEIQLKGDSIMTLTDLIAGTEADFIAPAYTSYTFQQELVSVA